MSTKYFGQISSNKLMQIIKSAIGGKVDKVTGKGLSTNDYTTEEKTKLAGIAAGAEVNVQADWGEAGTGSGAYIKNKPTKLSQFSNDAGFITDADIPEGAAASNATPLMDGAAAVGTSNAFARGDHVHPSDTSRVNKAGDTMTGNLNMGGKGITNASSVDADSLRLNEQGGMVVLSATPEYYPNLYLQRDDDSGNPVNIKNVNTPEEDGDAANKAYVDGKAPYVVTASGDAANANYAQIADAVEAGRAVFLKYTGDGQTTEYLPLTFLITTSKFAVFTCYESGYLYVYSVSSTGSFDRTGKKVLGEDDVTSMISSAISGVYTPKGTIAFASLPTASAGNLGWVYNISDAFTTTDAFVEGAGHSYGAGTNVVCVDAGSGAYKWDVLAGTIDLEEMTAAEVQAIWDSV